MVVSVDIDVSKDKHDCFIVSFEGEVLADVFTIPNTMGGFHGLLQRIQDCTRTQDKIKVGFEATGHYSYNLLGFLLDNGLPTYVLNPLRTNLYRKSLSLRKTKTDRVDARTIASMLLSDVSLKPYTDTAYHNEELKSLTRYRFDKVKERAKLKSSISRLVCILFPELEKMVPSLHMTSIYALLEEFPGAKQIAAVHLTKLKALLETASKGRYKRDMALEIRDSARNSIGSRMPAKSLELQHTIRLIRELDNEIAEIEEQIQSSMEELDSPITTIPGLGFRMAAMILAEVSDFTRFDSPDKLLAYAGMSPSTHTSLDYKEVEMPHPGQVSCKLWGLGGDGTVGANKNAITTIGLTANKYAQAYFSYDSMKSGGLTQSHLRFGDEPIRSTYLVSAADFVAVHAPTYVSKYDTTEDLKEGGIYLLNCPWSVEELESRLPGKVKRDLCRKHAQFYIIDAAKLAAEIGLGKRTNSILQAAFFALTKVIPLDVAVEDMKKNNYNSYFKKAGQKIVDLNNQAVDVGISAAVKVDIPASWADAVDAPAQEIEATPFVKDIVLPMDRQQGDKLPVSVFQKHGVLDGTWENGASAYAKRGVATKVPKWDGDKCAQCNRCAATCPHAAIRPVLLTDAEKAEVPASFQTVPAKGLSKDAPSYSYRMQISPYDCLGCGVCLTACPVEGALTMTPFEEMKEEQHNFDAVAMNERYLKPDVISDKNMKSIQFAKPYFQFSAACAGCAETTYIKLVSQLVGDRMYIGNAAGCSSAYSGGAPILPYCKDNRGFGPAWEHSLFEDNAEFAYGFFHAQDAIRKEILLRLESLREAGVAVDAIDAYLANWNDREQSRAVSDALIAALNHAESTPDVAFVLENKEYLSKKSVWAIGGDGWAYDIGFGGIDHVLAQNQDINLMVLDTEVYSNTGGQSSKATPTAAVAKFASGGKQIAKKDLGAIFMDYGYVYVAQVAIGYDQAQTLKAIREAEAYPGPSLIICYCPCLEQHIKAGMSCTQTEMKKAVECGYWQLYRYDPRRKAQGLNPFQLDSPAPDTSKLMDYLMGENRFASLKNNFPDRADALYQKAICDIQARYNKYRKMANDTTI